ncbi:MAG: DUF937 domain-containing protein [Bacteroidetes bacterium]|nr:MAG: DUF937 domain-containing protein [Bacteroidota bacterium]
MSLLNELSSQLSGPALQALSQQIGADPQSTQSAISAALPMLMGAMARNATQDQGAQALSNALARDHDGSILDDLQGFLGSTDNGPGAGILRHVLGSNQPQVAQGVSQMSGLNTTQVIQLLQNLAPLIMGMLGRQQRSQGLDAGSLASILMQERQVAAQQSQGGAALSMLNSFLDQDGDGSALDDIGGMLGGLFGKK